MIDRRPAAMQERARKQPSGDFECRSANVVRRRTGARVILQDGNSRPRMPDLRIEYPDGTVGYGEAVTDTDPAYSEMSSALWPANEPTPRVHPDPVLDRDWQVTVSSGADVKRLLRRAPTLLRQLGEAGLLLEWSCKYPAADATARPSRDGTRPARRR